MYVTTYQFRSISFPFFPSVGHLSRPSRSRCQHIELLHRTGDTRARERLALDDRQSLARIRHKRRQLDLHALLHLGARLLQKPAMLRKQIATARFGVVRARAGRVLQRRELFRARDLEHGKARRVREHVKDEELELHPVRLGRLDGRAVREGHVRDLLARDVEREVVFEGRDAPEERGRVEVVRDVARAEEQLARRRVARLCLRGGDLGVLDHVVLAVAERDDADRLGRVRFGNYFGGAVGLLVNAVADKDGVGYADETVVNAIGVYVEDLA